MSSVVKILFVFLAVRMCYSLYRKLSSFTKYHLWKKCSVLTFSCIDMIDSVEISEYVLKAGPHEVYT